MLNPDETSGLPHVWREIGEKIMYEADFDIETVTNRLKTEFAVEQQLPFDIALCLEHLHRRERDAS